MRPEVFLDTAYAIALSSPNDLFHQRAVQLADELKSAGTRLVTTRAEILNLQPRGYHAKPYQVKQVRGVILRYRLAGGNNEK